MHFECTHAVSVRDGLRAVRVHFNQVDQEQQQKAAVSPGTVEILSVCSYLTANDLQKHAVRH